MNSKLVLVAAWALLIFPIANSVCFAEECPCAHCACRNAQKVCRLVCKEKSVSVVCWGCLEEDFCLPGHSKEGRQHCEWVCADCESEEDVQAKPKRFVWSDWFPSGPASLNTRRKLMKRTITKKVPRYEWVVEDLCAECQASVTLPVAPSPEEIPSLPSLTAETKVLLATHSEPSDIPAESFEFDAGLSQPR